MNGQRMTRTARLLLVVALGAAACTSEPTDQAYGAECESFEPDPARPLFADSETLVDPEVLDWPTVDPVDVGLDPARLEEAADAVALSPLAASLLVMRDGRLAFERYLNGFDAADANNVHSATKSITSLLTGIAIDEGHLALDTPIGDVLPPEVVGEHGDVRVEDLLTMSAGFEVPDPDYEWEPGDTTTFLEHVLGRPRVAESGTEFTYGTGPAEVLAAVVTEATGEPLCEYAAQHLLGPLGIDMEDWHVEIGGYFTGGSSTFLTPRELARLGQLVIDDGAYEGEQLVSEAWLDQSLSPRWDLGCRDRPLTPERYGYLWWGYELGGHDVWEASGRGGQDVAVIPDLDMVVVITHDTTDGREGLRVPAIALLDDILLDAVEGATDAEPADECLAEALTMAIVPADGSTPPAPIAGWPPDAVGPLSPDATRLAFSQAFAAAWDLFTVDADGSPTARITHDAEPDATPAWSPDGSELAFARGAPNDTDLYVIGPDGTGLERLTDLDGWEGAATWSPDGARIAFVHDTTDVNGWGHPGELWVIDRDGSGLEPLRPEATANPAWSPDGRLIAFDGLGTDDHIGILDLETGTVADLGPGWFPRWSPDGTRIAYVQFDERGSSDLHLMSPDGADRVQLTDDPAFDTVPQWSPDGSTIWFATRAAGRES
jgi:CubicO group peptidase (beta-lactamase class C family)